MADLPYVLNNGTLEKFFNSLPNTGTPEKVTVKYLESVGFKSKNDRYLIAFLKDLGFVGSDGAPTEVWRDYRHTGESKKVMGKAVRQAWERLFKLYPDAHRKDDEAIRNWMRTHSPSSSPVTVDRSLKTFKAVVALADFTEAGGGEPSPAVSPTVSPEPAAQPAAQAAVPALTRQASPEVVINIQLEIPATSDPDTYDRFFAAMRKHLFPGNDE